VSFQILAAGGAASGILKQTGIRGLAVGIWKGFRSGLGIFSR